MLLIIAKPFKHFGHNRFYKGVDNAYHFLCSNQNLLVDYLLNIESSKLICSEALDNLTYNGKKYQFITWPLEPVGLAAEIFYRNGAWNGLTAVCYGEHYTETWWVAFGCNEAHLTGRFSTDEFRKAFLISIDYFDKFLTFAAMLPGGLILPRFKSTFIDKVPAAKRDDYPEPHNLMDAYYKTRTMFKIDQQVVTLSRGETEVLAMIARGFNSHEIGKARGTSVKTVETGMTLRSELSQLYHDQFGVLLK